MKRKGQVPADSGDVAHRLLLNLYGAAFHRARMTGRQGERDGEGRGRGHLK